MYPGRKFRTRLPIRVIPREHNFEELFQRNIQKKMQMKGYADDKRYVKPSDIQVGDSVLIRQETSNKATPACETEPLQVQYRKGNRVVAKRPDGRSITRTKGLTSPLTRDQGPRRSERHRKDTDAYLKETYPDSQL